MFFFYKGLEHISDLNAYDHILFIAALAVIYPSNEWRKLALLITAFTFGHALSLGLSIANIIQISPKVTEFLIPLTIIVTCLHNAKTSYSSNYAKKMKWLKYGIVLFLGLYMV